MPQASRSLKPTKGFVALLSGALLFAANGFAQTVPEVKVPAPPFTERRVENVNTSGGQLVGVQFGDMRTRATDNLLTVSGLRDTDQTICVKISHVSGAYSADFEMANPRRGATVRFVLPSKIIARLDAKAGELGVVVRAATRAHCNATDPILPAAWGRQAPLGAGFALVNDHQASITRISLGGSRLETCQSVKVAIAADIAPTAYNMACPVQTSRTCATDAALAVQLISGATQDNSLRASLRSLC